MIRAKSSSTQLKLNTASPPTPRYHVYPGYWSKQTATFPVDVLARALTYWSENCLRTGLDCSTWVPHSANNSRPDSAALRPPNGYTAHTAPPVMLKVSWMYCQIDMYDYYCLKHDLHSLCFVQSQHRPENWLLLRCYFRLWLSFYCAVAVSTASPQLPPPPSWTLVLVLKPGGSSLLFQSHSLLLRSPPLHPRCCFCFVPCPVLSAISTVPMLLFVLASSLVRSLPPMLLSWSRCLHPQVELWCWCWNRVVHPCCFNLTRCCCGLRRFIPAVVFVSCHVLYCLPSPLCQCYCLCLHHLWWDLSHQCFCLDRAASTPKLNSGAGVETGWLFPTTAVVVAWPSNCTHF